MISLQVSYAIAGGIFGLLVGSFLAARVLRTIENRPQNLWGRSVCFSCGQSLGILDMIPVLSFLLLRGRCRHCKKPFSTLYAWVEVSTALLFALLCAHLAPLLTTPVQYVHALLQLCLGGLLIYTAAVDLRLHAFPVRGLQGMTVLLLLWSAIAQQPPFLDGILGSLAFGGSLAGIRWIGGRVTDKEVMGSGDVWLALLLGSALGVTHTVVAFYGAFVSGAALGLFVLARAKKQHRPAAPLPFAPFLVFGWLMAVLFGDPLFRLLFPIF